MGRRGAGAAAGYAQWLTMDERPREPLPTERARMSECEKNTAEIVYDIVGEAVFGDAEREESSPNYDNPRSNPVPPARMKPHPSESTSTNL